MKKLLILLLLISTSAFAQEPICQMVNEVEKTALLKQLCKPVESFSCHFVEEKWIALLEETVTSKGTIHYKAPNQLVCEYSEPESIVLSKDADGNLSVTKNGKTVPPSMMYKQMMDMMFAFVTGEAVRGSDEYNVEAWRNDKEYIVSLTPKAKARFSVIELHLDPAGKRIQKTVLKEAKGDTTTITMTE